MLSLLVAAALVPVSYTLPPQKPAIYDVQVNFEGYMPVLGGQEGTAQVDLEFTALGVGPDKEGNPQAATELQGIKFSFNGAQLPLDLDKARFYFPKTTLSLTPQGRVLKTDAPDVALPIRLPGLDIKRIPDLTFLPIEFPKDGVEAGSQWSFTKAFGNSEVTYQLKATEVTDDQIQMDLQLSQSYDSLEDAAKSIPANPKDAISKVHTDMTGTGKATFDRKLGLIRLSSIDATAVSTVTPVEGGAPTQRTLKTKVVSKLASAPTLQARQMSREEEWKAKAALYWELAKIKAKPWAESAWRAISQQIATLQAWLKSN